MQESEVKSDDELNLVKVKQPRKKKEKEITVDEETIAEIAEITENKLKKLLPKQPRSEKQIEQTKKIIDLRKNKMEEGIKLKVIPKKKRVKQILPPADSDVSTEESEPDTETEAYKQPTSFKAAKPVRKEKKRDEVDDAEEKLNKINSLLYSNPYYAQIIASRQRK
jgi:hypothetical protein